MEHSKTLHEVASENLLATKWLIAPSRRVAHSWIESLVRSGQPAVNLRPCTIDQLATELVGHQLTATSLGVANTALATLALESVWDQLPTDGYFGRLSSDGSLPGLVAQAIRTLKLADVDIETVAGSAFQSATKFTELKWLHQQYQAFLQQHQLVDTADLLDMATASRSAASLQPNTLVLVPEGTTTTRRGDRMLAALAEDQRVTIVPPTPSTENTSNSAVHFYRAVGECNEVREVLRRCVQGGIPLDEVEIVVSDSQTYVPLLYGLAFRYAGMTTQRSIPMTFSTGLPASLSRPGRALQGWLDWVAADYPQSLLADLISNGLFVIPGEQATSVSLLSRLLRPLGIGHGADGYLVKIDEQIVATKRAEKSADETTQPALIRRQTAYRALRKLIEKLLSLGKSFHVGSSMQRLMLCDQFLQNHARSVDDFDKASETEMRTQINQRVQWYQELNLQSDCRSFLRGLASQTRVLSSGPKAGHLHVSTWSSAGSSGRSNLFSLGMDDHRFPGSIIQDPVLLDQERELIDSDLELSSDRAQQRFDAALELLSASDAHVTLSWPCQELTDERESFPSPVMLSIYRQQSGDTDADVRQLCDHAGTPVSFAPSDPEQSLDASERWLWRLSETDVRGSDQQSMLDFAFPHLAAGRLANSASEFGPFTGHVPQAGADLDPFDEESPVLSASALETLGRCPRAFFFRNALRLYPPDEIEVDPDQWLDARQMGLLLHDVFRRFMVELTTDDKRPEFERDHFRLAEILGTVVAEFREQVPPPNENAFRTQYWQLIQIARIFLHDESQHCQHSQPKYFEVAIGLPSIGDGGLLDSEQPSQVRLPGGKSIRARGQIDRVDQVSPDRFAIWDYKIGSGYGYDKNDPFRQGRKLQNVLYLAMVQAALRAKLGPAAIVERFGYFFPSLRAQGLRIDWSSGQLAGGLQLIESLAAVVRDGVFVATDNHRDDCKFCDYQTICGDVESVCRRTKQWLNSDLPVLQPFAEVRHG